MTGEAAAAGHRPTPSAPTLTVAILTYQRPATLEACLRPVVAQVEALAAEGAGAGAVDGEVLVVDNDPDASAREFVESVTAEHPAVRYVVETTPGIAAARQRCLDEVRGRRLIVFIDDDEEPGDAWLASMVSTWRGYGEPAGVAGMILPRYQSPPSAFVRAGGFFVRALYPTGTELHAYPTSNLLLDVSFLEAHGLGFNQRLGMHGGEDTLLTSAVTRLGGRIVACRESEVFDLVPDARNNREWVLARAQHIGVSHSVIELVDVPPGPRRIGVRLRMAAGGSARAVVGGLRAIGGRALMLIGPAAERGLGTYARGLRMMNRGIGMVRGALPGVAPQYRREG